MLPSTTSAREAQNAINELNDTELLGRLIFVREDRESAGSGIIAPSGGPGFSGHHSGGGGGGNKIYVGNLSWNIAWQDLKDHFKRGGANVTRADVISGPDGRSKGFGIVEFSTPREAAIAIATFNDTTLDGRQIFVREDREDGVRRGQL